MNNELPIIVKPSRLIWGLIFLATALLFALDVYIVAFTEAVDEEWLKWLLYAAAVFFIYEMLIVAWNGLVAPPRMVIDEGGVGGRFAAGASAGAARIAWDDITGARYVSEYSVLSQVRYFFVVLDVNNTGGKYPVGKVAHWWSPFAWWEKFILSHVQHTFAFEVSSAKLSEERAKEVVAIINKHAKGKPPDKQDSAKPQDSAKSSFAAD